MTTLAKTKRVEDAAFWRGHCEAWQQSGQTIKAYIEAHGLSRSTFGRWRRQLTGSAPMPSSSRAPRLARVEVSPAVAVEPRCRLELPNGIGLDWPVAGSAERLGAILEAAKRWD